MLHRHGGAGIHDGDVLKVGLIDVDGHNFPNLALMRISSYHKARGDEVEWWWSDFIHYDVVYMSKVFSDAYSPDKPEPMNADKVIKGGTGYCISLVDGKEVFDQSKNTELPPEIEHCYPDYSIYPQYQYAVAMTSRGCPRGCSFCHVASKEGRCSVKVADVSDFWRGEFDLIQCCDPNILACKDKRDLLAQYKATGARVNFNQGLDIRLMTEQDMEDIRQMRIENLHFAWDNPKDNLEQKFKTFADFYGRSYNSHGGNGTVYCLTNFNSTHEEDLYRIMTLKKYGFKPYVMLYDKPHADRWHRNLQRWCNNNFVFYSTNSFEEYLSKGGTP